MTKLNYPDRIFSLSDCHGGQREWDPFTSPDIAARLAESIRSGFTGIQHFDTFGLPLEGYQYLVSEACRLQQEHHDVGRTTTGVFINDAPRTKKKNGNEFYVAEFENGLRVVATPLEVLAEVQDKIRSLKVLPNPQNENESNGLHWYGEQHRSSFTPRLLADNHGVKLEDYNPDREVPGRRENAHLGYIDRFGNLVLVGCSGALENTDNEAVEIRIGSIRKKVEIAASLGEATPGDLIAYKNDGNVEVLRKSKPKETSDQRLRNSAYEIFSRPKIGALVEIDK